MKKLLFAILLVFTYVSVTPPLQDAPIVQAKTKKSLAKAEVQALNNGRLLRSVATIGTTKKQLQRKKKASKQMDYSDGMYLSYYERGALKKAFVYQFAHPKTRKTTSKVTAVMQLTNRVYTQQTFKKNFKQIGAVKRKKNTLQHIAFDDAYYYEGLYKTKTKKPLYMNVYYYKEGTVITIYKVK